MNQKGFIKYLVIVILGVVILVSGYFYFSKKPANAPAESNQVSTNQTKTAGWKTYKNNERGFEIKYPTDFKLNISSSGITVTKVYTNSKDFARLSVANNASVDFIPKEQYGFSLVSSGPFKVGEVVAESAAFSSGIGNLKFILVKKDGRYYGVEMESVNSDELTILEQIISTFKFY